MQIAVFKNKVFQVDTSKIYTFKDFTYSSVLNTEHQDVDGKKPSTYVKGPGLDNFGIVITLETSNGVNPRQEWEEWQQILAQSLPDTFILGGKPIGENKWLLKSVSPSDVRADNTGNITGLTLSLEFEEYVRPGQKPAGKSGNTAAGLKNKVNIQDEISALLMTSEEKQESKRYNPGMRWW